MKAEQTSADDALRSTGVPAENPTLQAFPQFMPEGLLVTVPLPVPDFDKLKVKLLSAKVALIVWLAVTLVKV